MHWHYIILPCRFTQECTKLDPELVDSGAHSINTQIQHKYLGMIDARVTVQLGGTKDQRLLVFQIHCLAGMSGL